MSSCKHFSLCYSWNTTCYLWSAFVNKHAGIFRIYGQACMCLRVWHICTNECFFTHSSCPSFPLYLLSPSLTLFLTHFLAIFLIESSHTSACSFTCNSAYSSVVLITQFYRNYKTLWFEINIFCITHLVSVCLNCSISSINAHISKLETFIQINK